ncbi:hypothetical protein NLJ89_g2595 [Agrocybe chaxingu]|uniref:CCHC-type domain-containing protein n=1 Tax=Agrocybe chaxingu TaxID=84603 RepID=A0A9W8K6A4_9AGAR|nr:hypothetical protein NLJ89_g2595 [Agrocybe chaxingu]
MHSQKTYSLRTRTTGQETPAPDPSAVSTLAGPQPSSAEAVVPTPRRTYAEIAGSRSPSQDNVIRDSSLSTDVNFGPNRNRYSAMLSNDGNDDVVPSKNENLERWVDKNPNPWTVVGPRRSRSLTSLHNAKTRNDKPIPVVNIQNTTSPDPIVQAEKLLTSQQRERIGRRYVSLAPQTENSPQTPVSRGEGPSRAKGKGPDTLNWGNSGIPADELDLEYQRSVLQSLHDQYISKQKALRDKFESLNARKRADLQKNISNAPVAAASARSYANTVRSTGQQVFNHDIRMTHAPESRPIDQIASDSYLGKTLQGIDHFGTRRVPEADGDPSSSGSSSSDESYDPSSGKGETPRRSHRHRSTSHHSGRHRSKTRTRSTLKPIPPKEYDGTADTRSYNRFVTEGTAYVHDGRVPRDRRVFVLSYYLSGIAYDFYVQKVSMNVHEWSLPEFFAELFNYAFPINYRMEQRAKLKRTFQNDKRVSAYVHELEELYNMIGVNDPREKVIKLWNGLRASIQRGLWRDHLNPEISSWNDVVNHAEIIEISEGISEARDKRPLHVNKSSGSSNHPVPGHSGSLQRRGRGLPFNRSGSRPFNKERSQVPQTFPNNRPRSQAPRPAPNVFRPNNNNYTKPFTKNSTPARQNTPALSDKERSELLAAGKCFRCKEPGHLSRNCPQGTSVRASGSKPPGVSNFNIELTAEESPAPSDDVEVVDSLYLGMASISPRDFPVQATRSYFGPEWDTYDPNSPRRERLGDALAYMAEHSLNMTQPYPGDSQFIDQERILHRFYVTRGEGPFYLIYDKYQVRRAEIHESYLKDQYFRLGQWYADKLNEALGQSDDRSRLQTMSDAYGHNAALVLASGITSLYPTRRPDVDDDLRFTVVQRSLLTHFIHDDDYEGIPIIIDSELLSNVNFDLGNWYKVRRFNLLEGSERASACDDNSMLDLSPDLPVDQNREDGLSPGIPSLEDNNLDLREAVDDAPTQPSTPISPEEINWELAREGNIVLPDRPIGDLVGKELIHNLAGNAPYPGDPPHL